MAYNKVILEGRLVRDPELRHTQSSLAVTTITIAVDRRTKEDKTVDFIRCTAWRQTAEFISKYFTKGSGILVEGNLKMNNWEDEKGEKRSSLEVMVEKVEFPIQTKENNHEKQQENNAGFGAFYELKDDGDVPF